MSKKVPEGWEVKNLGLLTKPVTMKSEYNNQYEPLTSSRSGLVKQSEYFNKRITSADNTGYRIVTPGEFTFRAMSDDGTFKFNRSKFSFKGIVSPAYEVFEARNCNSDFLEYVLNSDQFHQSIYSNAQGGTRLALKYNSLHQIAVPLPPFSEQKKIASILTSVNEVIENTQKQINKLQDLKKATMNELLTKGIDHTEFKDSEIGRIPKSWSVKSLEEACEKIGDGLHATPVYTEGTSYFFVNGNNLERGRIRIVPETKTVSENEYLNHFIELNDRTILMSINGTIGNLAFYNSESVILGKSACYMVFSEGFHKNFFYYLLASDRTQKYFSDELTGTTIKNLSLKTIRAIFCAIPPSDEQVKISEILLSIEEHIEKKERQASETQSLKKSLMQDLLTGKVRVKVN